MQFKLSDIQSWFLWTEDFTTVIFLFLVTFLTLFISAANFGCRISSQREVHTLQIDTFLYIF